MGDKGGVQDSVLAHVPKPSFGVLIYCGMLGFFRRGQKEDCVATSQYIESAAHGCVNARDSH